MSTDPLMLSLQAASTQLPEGGVVVAFSGGLDSSVLLHALAAHPPTRARGLRALHVDHGLHPRSGQWTRQCAQFAAALDLPFAQVTLSGISVAGSGIEGAARKARYAAFAEALNDGEILATAQHADDQAETVLLKLLRGAGPEGLGGMRALRPFARGQLWRPLLPLSRALLLQYARAHGLSWIDDPTNAETHLRRNFLRHEILPRLRERWPDAGVAIAHSAAWSRAAADYIDGEARIALARLRGADPATLRWRHWIALPAALRDPALRMWLRDLRLDQPAHFHVQELERQLMNACADSSPCVRWAGCEVRRYRELIYAMPVARPFPIEWQAHWQQMDLRLPDGSRLRWRRDDEPARSFEPPALRVCYRRGGERIKPDGDTHTRELRLLLQEAGIPPWQRERIPLLHAGDDLIAVADLFLSTAARELCGRVGARIVWEHPA